VLQNVTKDLRLEKTKYRWEGNIRRDLRKMVCEDVNWMHLAQDREQ
jgi:hypothetical protein